MHGNAYVTGSFQALWDFDTGRGTTNLTSAGSNDYFWPSMIQPETCVVAKKIW
jgi:hypothetical protein